MCGIFGFTGSPIPGRAAAMAELLGHRGPDARAWAEEPAATLGATRLAIVDVDNGDQPLRNEEGDLLLVANGEIYNHLELRQRLERLGHRFATASDSEVVLHLYEELGEGALAELDGMFAFALWDGTGRRLLLARDRFGMKPLFFARHQERWLFASELKAILAPASMPRQLDAGSLDALLRFHLLPPDRTMFPNVRALPPGHLLWIDPASGDEAGPARRYWSPRVRPEPFRGDAPATFLRLLDAAVASHLATEVPQAFSLSGGLDSSAVVALARRRLGRPIPTYSIGSAGPGDERPLARAVAEHCATDHHEIEFDAAELLERLPLALWHLEVPLSGAMSINHALFERVAREARVLLIGEGSDELLGGYDRIKSVVGPLAWAPASLGRRAYHGASSLLLGRRRVYQPEWRRALPTPLPGDPELRAIFARRGARRRDAVLEFEQGFLLPGSHLIRVDRLAMAHSLEARLPFLDRAVAEFANRLPDGWKMRWRGEKWLLREAMRGLLPEEIRLRPKYGMRTPDHLWRKSGALEAARSMLSDAAAQRRGLFRQRYVRGLLARVGGRRELPFDRTHLHQLLVLEAWHRVFIDPQRLAPPAAGAAAAFAPR